MSRVARTSKVCSKARPVGRVFQVERYTKLALVSRGVWGR